MQVLIEIPDEEYKKISNSNPSYADDFSIYYAIKNGIPLPKGHGRLIDDERLKETIHRNTVGDLFDQLIDMQPTIIEADKESEDKE